MKGQFLIVRSRLVDLEKTRLANLPPEPTPVPPEKREIRLVELAERERLRRERFRKEISTETRRELDPAVAKELEKADAAFWEENYADAIRAYERLARQGVPDAQTRLGLIYSLGLGVLPNHAEAVSWLRRAAGQGDAKAKEILETYRQMLEEIELADWSRAGTVPEEWEAGEKPKTAKIVPLSRARGPVAESLLPPYTGELEGDNPVRVVNPNVFGVDVGIRTGGQGKDFRVPPKDSRTVYVPDGQYELFFVYANESGALYKGEPFTLRESGVEIQIVQVADGNYSIERVK
jgi:hypothetical protein